MMTPKLRFPEFRGEWQGKEFGHFLDSVSSGKSDTTSDGIEYLIYGSTGVIGKSRNYDYFGDKLLIARVGANAGSMYRVDGKYKVSDNTLIVSLRESLDTTYARYLLTKANLSKLVFGSGQPLVTGGQLKKLKVVATEKLEQQKIAGFLTAVDDRVAAQQQKVELLKKYKKGVMQKIFTQQIRFKDESGNPYPDWQEKKLGVISDVKGGKRIPKGFSLQLIANGHPYITISDMKNGSIEARNIRYVPNAVQNIIKNYTISPSDIYVSVAGTLGLIGVVPYSLDGANLTENADKLTNIKINRSYLLQYLSTHYFKKLIKNVQTNNAQPKLSISALQRFQLQVPSDDEQQKIADFLTSLDDKIKLEETGLEQMKNFKKSLLQRMFI